MTFEDPEIPGHGGVPILPPRRSERVSSRVSELQAETGTGGVKRGNVPKPGSRRVSDKGADAGGIRVISGGASQVQGIANGPHVGGQAVGEGHNTADLPAANHVAQRAQPAPQALPWAKG